LAVEEAGSQGLLGAVAGREIADDRVGDVMARAAEIDRAVEQRLLPLVLG
jgi:hypothetical protein